MVTNLWFFKDYFVKYCRWGVSDLKDGMFLKKIMARDFLLTFFYFTLKKMHFSLHLNLDISHATICTQTC